MEYKILRVKNVLARKEHKCDVCGGTIQRGERYQSATVIQDGKIHTSKRHIQCHDEVKATSEQDFKKEIRLDTKKMMEVFSFDENMQIAFFPLVITELAWHFAYKTMEMAARDMVSETRKLSRVLKQLRKKYEEECMKDLDREHFDYMVTSTKKVIEKCETDLTLLFFSANSELKRTNYGLPYMDMRTYAYMSMAMVDALAAHNTKMNALIAERLGCDTRIMADAIPKSTRVLNECMAAYLAPAEYELIDHIQTSIKIILNKIQQCEFVIN